jgi:hypothetical protein
MKVWVVLDQLATPDGDDGDVDLAAVHASREGAEANLTPDGSHGAKSDSPRQRFAVEMELLP